MTSKKSSTSLKERVLKWGSPINLAFLLMLSLPFERIPSWQMAGVSVRPSLIIGALLILSALLTYGRRLLPYSAPQRYFYIFLFFSFLSALAAISINRAFMVLVFFAFVFLVAQALSLTVDKAASGLRKWLIIGGVVVCLFATYQFFGDLLGLPSSLTGLRVDYIKEVLGFPRVQAASLEPLYFANYLLLPLAIVLAAGLKDRRWYWLAGLFSTFIYLTVSRGGAAGAAVICLVIWIYAMIYRKWIEAGLTALSLTAGIGIAFFLMTVVAPAIALKSTGSGPSKPTTAYQQHATDFAEVSQPQDGRSQTRGAAIRLFAKHSILGVGPGNFGPVAFREGSVTSPTQIVNNLPLEILAETGIFGGVSFLVFIVSLIINGFKAIKNIGDQEIKFIGLGALAFVFGAAVQYQATSTLYIMTTWVGIGLLFGAIAVNRKTHENSNHS
jgi:O-antigen ligase